MDMHIKSLNAGVIEPILQRLNDPQAKYVCLQSIDKIHSNLLRALTVSLNRNESLFRHDKESFGIFHITESQHVHLWDEHLVKEPELASFIRGLASQHQFLQTPHNELSINLNYSTAIAAFALSLEEMTHKENLSLYQHIALLNQTFPGFKGISKKEWLAAEKRLQETAAVETKNSLSTKELDNQEWGVCA